jgi:hypothetical protein
MNRLFSIAGFLAAGAFAFLIFFAALVPFSPVVSSNGGGRHGWIVGLWVLGVLVGIRVLLGFLAFSTESHWAALRRNTQITPAAWRRVCGVYVLLAVIFFVSIPGDGFSGTHRLELFSALFFGSCCSALAVISIVKGFRRPHRDVLCNPFR